MASSPSIDGRTFLAYLRQSGLVEERELAEIRRRYPETRSGRSLARALMHDKVLTRFQAERLLVGRTQGFTLGQYRILEQVGRGGMGRVYKAEHRTMRRVVALKVLAPELLKTERAVELFLHEVRSVAQLVHPHIVAAFDANEVDGRYYLVLEFVDGPNLDQLVRKQGPLSPGLACDYILQATRGLGAAHARGMLHRDIKPANVLVQWHGQGGDGTPGMVKVSDFGLARRSEPTTEYQRFNDGPGTIFTKENTVMGTPDYLSPEQARSLHKTDIRSDLYSLGCTFYFLLTGRVPFPGGNALDKMIRHSTEAPAPIATFRDDVPAEVVAVVEKLMEKKPEGRYQTPNELAEALAPFAVSGPTPWAPNKTPSTAELRVFVPRPEAADASGDDFVPSGSDGDMPIFAATLGNDLSPTPFGEARQTITVPVLRRHGPAAGWRFRVGLISAAAVIGGMAALLALLKLVGR